MLINDDRNLKKMYSYYETSNLHQKKPSLISLSPSKKTNKKQVCFILKIIFHHFLSTFKKMNPKNVEQFCKFEGFLFYMWNKKLQKPSIDFL